MCVCGGGGVRGRVLNHCNVVCLILPGWTVLDELPVAATSKVVLENDVVTIHHLFAPG